MADAGEKRSGLWPRGSLVGVVIFPLSQSNRNSSGGALLALVHSPVRRLRNPIQPGTFVGDVVNDTGWSNRLQLIFQFTSVYTALSAISGWLTDRMGPRPVVAVGAVLLTSGYLLWATASNASSSR